VKKSIQYSRTFALQVQTSWNQAHASLLVKSFPKTPRTWSETSSQFGGSHNYKTKQNKTNYLPSEIDGKATVRHNPCFVLFCFDCQRTISQTRVLPEVVLISLKSSWWGGVHRLGFRLFGATLWNLLIIEPILSMTINFKIFSNKLHIVESIDYWTHFVNENKIQNIFKQIAHCGIYWLLNPFSQWK